MRHSLTAFLFVMLLAGQAGAGQLAGRCDIRFFGESTLHGFDGQASCQPFSLSSEEGIRGLSIDVPVKEMNTGSSGRDKKMQSMFESDHYPVIRGLFHDIDVENMLHQLNEDGADQGHLDFDLKIREETRHVQARTRNLAVSPESISFLMDFTLSLADFQLKPPSILGMVRVNDQVRVEVMVFLSRQ